MVQNIVAFILHSWVCTYFGCSGSDQPCLCLSPASFLLCSRSCLVEIGMSNFTCAKYLVSLSNCVGQMRHTQRACYWICLYIELIHWSIDPSYISCPALFHLFCLTNQRSRSFIGWLLHRKVHSVQLFFSLLMQLDSHFVFETFLLSVLLCSQAWHAVPWKISEQLCSHQHFWRWPPPPCSVTWWCHICFPLFCFLWMMIPFVC